MSNEHKEVAALLALDIDIAARAFPDNKAIQILKGKRDKIIDDPEHRRMRYKSGLRLFNLKDKE